jgi:ATP-dependent DNA helicase RecQ
LNEILIALKACLGPDAKPREGQLEAIDSIVNKRERVLVVQKTGWGKSIVYFVATKLLRELGSGPTLVVSPLIALMRNQEIYGKRLGVEVRQITSENLDDHEKIFEELVKNKIDLLLISPERLSNESFLEAAEIIFQEAGLLVIDEAHCISDWGHDFRPDYRRLSNVVKQLPPRVPVLATTATANNRVIDDIREQLGDDVELKRGTLERDSLSLNVNTDVQTYAQKLALVYQAVNESKGTGVVYSLTVQDTEIITTWLMSQGIDAKSYSGQSEKETRIAIEDALIKNKVKVVVATSALGMGFDKPDLSFVIHFHTPPSPAAYYQQVGRAGRNLKDSLGLLMFSESDTDIWDYFDRSSIFETHEINSVLGFLKENSKKGSLRIGEIEKNVNIARSRLDKLIKKLEVEGHLFKENNAYSLTPKKWVERFHDIDEIVYRKKIEHTQMMEYLNTKSCRMKVLRGFLDDKTTVNCNKCDNCLGFSKFEIDPKIVEKANAFLFKKSFPITPRLKWFEYNTLKSIPTNLLVEKGLSRSLMSSNLGRALRNAKNNGDEFPEHFLITMCELLRKFPGEIKPKYIAYIPSLKTNRNQVKHFVYKLGKELGLTVLDNVVKTQQNDLQKLQKNSWYQSKNVENAFKIVGDVPHEPIYLFDDIVDSRWTMTHVGALLRKHGATKVFPISLVVSRSE